MMLKEVRQPMVQTPWVAFPSTHSSGHRTAHEPPALPCLDGDPPVWVSPPQRTPEMTRFTRRSNTISCRGRPANQYSRPGSPRG